MTCNHAELKSLQSKLNALHMSIQELEKEQGENQKKLLQQKAQAKEVAQKIEKLKLQSRGLIVSEHAILRYLERVEGIDIELIKQKILPKDIEKLALCMGNGTFPVNDPVCKHSVIVKDGVVTTVLA